MSSDWPWKFHAVVFDLDGLIIDTEPIFEEAARRLLARRGLLIRHEVLQAMMGTPARRALEIFRHHHQLEDTVEELSLESSTLFHEVLGEAPVVLMPGVAELLDRLEQKRIPKAIATSSSSRYLKRILAPHGFLDRFAFALTCDDVVNGKPSPEIYQKAAAEFPCLPEEMVVLEDSPNGLRAAKAARARCVVVPHARVPLDQLEGADAVVPSLHSQKLWQALGI
jgi:HAD superfamily hydrolase (TIGR01509 family)